MNHAIIDTKIDEFRRNITSVLIKEIDFAFSNEISDHEFWNFQFSDKRIDIHNFNDNWITLCKENLFNNTDKKFAANQMLNHLASIKELLERRIKVKNKEIENTEKFNWFSFNDISYNSLITYFNSEFLEDTKTDTNNENTNNLISWENQTELSELIYVLFHSKRVLKNGKPIEIKDLTELFNKTFNTNIKTPTDLVNKSVKSYKKSIDGKTFISELNTILEVYKKQTLDKDSK